MRTFVLKLRTFVLKLRTFVLKIEDVRPDLDGVDDKIGGTFVKFL